MSTSTLHLGIFYMPQIYDLGPTALLPLRRKACWGFFRPLKIRRLRPGLNPRTRVLKASTLPLDHRSRLGCAYILQQNVQTPHSVEYTGSKQFSLTQLFTNKTNFFILQHLHVSAYNKSTFMRIICKLRVRGKILQEVGLVLGIPVRIPPCQ